MSKRGRARDRQRMRQRVGDVLDGLPLEYVVDEVVRRVAGSGSSFVTFVQRDGFVVERRTVYTRPARADLRSLGVAHRAWLREREIERRGG